MKNRRLTTPAALAMTGLVLMSAGLAAGEWSAPVGVGRGFERSVTYRAKLSNQWLLVEVEHAPGWHTYAIDNKLRAEDQLQGKRALGIEAPTEIKLHGNWKLVGPWYQTPPQDLSKPELRWFTWGFSAKALFAARVALTEPGERKVTITGQACNDTTCLNIETEIPISGSAAEDEKREQFDVKQLSKVRQAKQPEDNGGDAESPR